MRRTIVIAIATLAVVGVVPRTAFAAMPASATFALAHAQAWPGVTTWGTLTGAFNANFPGWIRWDGGSYITGPLPLTQDPLEIKFTIPKDASVGLHTVDVRLGYGELMSTIATAQIEVIAPPPAASLMVTPNTAAPGDTLRLSGVALPGECGADPLAAFIGGRELPVANVSGQTAEYGQTGVFLADVTADVTVPTDAKQGKHQVGFVCADWLTATVRVSVPTVAISSGYTSNTQGSTTTATSSAPGPSESTTTVTPAPDIALPPPAGGSDPSSQVPVSGDTGVGPPVFLGIGLVLLLGLVASLMHRRTKNIRRPHDIRVTAHRGPVSTPVVEPVAGRTLFAVSLRTSLVPTTYVMKETAP